jgi:broad specificity phosphatase PhoE
MKRLIIRHALTDGNRLERHLLGKEGAPINAEGKRQVRELKKELAKRKIDLDQPVAVSELLRTVQTAEGAGFTQLRKEPLLNEINTRDPARTQANVLQGILPPEAVQAAQKIVASPPQEKVWVTHGLVIAALLVELGLSEKNNFVPKLCSITEVDI